MSALLEKLKALPEDRKRQVLEYLESLAASEIPSPSRAANGDEVLAPALRARVPEMHPGAARMAPDFDAPLPDSFWLSGEWT